MKSKLFISGIVIAFVLNCAVVAASEIKDSDLSAKNLQNQIVELFTPFPYELNCFYGDQCKLTIKFFVNDKKEIVDVKYECENKDLIRYARRKFENACFKIPDDIKSRTYGVNIIYNY